MIRRLLRNGWQMPGKRPEVRRIRQVLEAELDPFQRRIHRRELYAWERRALGQRLDDGTLLVAGAPRGVLVERLSALLRVDIEDQLRRRSAMALEFANFRRAYLHAATSGEREDLVLGFALTLGARPGRLRGDRRALRRWFGYDAVSERYERWLAKVERRIIFALDRLGALAGFIQRQDIDGTAALSLWRRLDLEPLARSLFVYAGNPRVRSAAFRAVSRLLARMPEDARTDMVTDTTLRFVYRTALEQRQDTWLQCAALNFLAVLAPESLDRVIAVRLKQPGEGDDLFVRRCAVRWLGARLPAAPELAGLIAIAVVDPSPAVRQTVAEILPAAPVASVALALTELLDLRNETAVRAAALLAMARCCARAELRDLVRRQLRAALAQETDVYVLRVALDAVVEGYGEQCADVEPASRWLGELLPAIAALHVGAPALAVRRWAAQARERLWGLSDPGAALLLARLAPEVCAAAEGRPRRVRWLREVDPQLLGRVLALLALRDFGIDVHQTRRGAVIVRGNRFGFRLWRWLHEFRHPGTDKRQGFRHVVGRLYRGGVRANSPIVAELAQTKVPGEPLLLSGEEGWRPYLPLVDEMISALDRPFGSPPLRLFTSEGVTEVAPPPSLWRRLRARYALTRNFVHYAQLRNWREDSALPCGSYVAALRELGFVLRLRPHGAETAAPATIDPAVTRFFTATAALPGLQTIEELRSYFFSVYGNSLPELALFIGVLLAIFGGRHLAASRRIRRNRGRIPVSIGGWGTRGKSGTERLKAALFNALGHTVVSKTTGCEAMFLYGPAGGALREMFLYRPYDKATIWEQANVIDIAGKLDVDIFLWECMGLTPAYVSILQQQWMRDDLATITNTYPDHEDVQGPAGINIPQVMTNFIPRGATLITSEEQMLPILADDARIKGTRMHSIGWREAGLITSDVLHRFPYAEHPFNIALVCRMAAELGIDGDFALKEMADRVVADLGVLKASPIASVRGRRLEFINGMSANERYGCLGNFQRMGFVEQDPYRCPDVHLATVVNNRADRVPRSKVFAAILVNDVGADHHYLIGTNLDGLQNYIWEAWAEYSAGVTLDDQARGRSPAAVLEETARRFRIAYRDEQVQERLSAMLDGLGTDTDTEADTIAAAWRTPQQLADTLGERLPAEQFGALVAYTEQRIAEVAEYGRLATRIAAGERGAQLDADFRAQLRTWFERKLVVIADAHASGDQVIDTIVRHSPPGLLTRIMGMQNIKGTGLDFVYRWQAWETCARACDELCSGADGVAERGLRALAGFREYGLLCEDRVRQALAQAQQMPVAHSEWFPSESAFIRTNLDDAMQRLRTHLQVSGGGGRIGFVARLLTHVESFLDAGDAVRRRKRANLIYRELGLERIGLERAALELQALIKRQKGGWLEKWLEGLLRGRR